MEVVINYLCNINSFMNYFHIMHIVNHKFYSLLILALHSIHSYKLKINLLYLSSYLYI